MSNPAEDALSREKKQIEASVFVGEEGEDPSTPNMNMVAALFLALFGLLAIYFAWDLSVPDSFYTAPGLLPILVGITLVGMAAGLAHTAWKSGASLRVLTRKNRLIAQFMADVENRRSLVLMGLVAAYVFAVDFLGFDLRIPLGFFTFQFGSYELFSIIALIAILKIFWRASYLYCALVAVGWVMALAAVFRYGFRILLPGSG
ncbi:MAG: hypothetical protein HQ483_08655 [Rhodospirillales bacterium]|nr:hypothetical protein [Rhodospirillales bacterium]